MSNTFMPNWPPSELNAEFLPAASKQVQIGDLLYWSSGDNAPIPASNLADLGTAALMQTAFARLFVGVANSARLSTDTTTTTQLRVMVDGIWEFTCDSSTFAIGDYVGASYNTNVLRNQQVAKVAGAHMAIGRVVKRYGSATTKVKCRIMGRYLLGLLGDPFRQAPVPVPPALTTLADQDNTLTVDTLVRYYKQTPTTNPRKLIMPAEAQCAGVEVAVVNLAGATNAIQVRNSGDSTTVVSIPATKTGYLWCDGTTWYGLVSA
jgi:hypothetical protein